MVTSVTNSLGFRDAMRIREQYSPNLALARQEGRKLKLRPAKLQRDRGERRLLVLIDEEWDFSDKGRLPVRGMFDDIERLIKRIEQGTLDEKYTDLIITLDLHPPHTVHNDSWWVDEQGNPPDVSLPVQMELVSPSERFPFLALFLDGRPRKAFRPRYMGDWTTNKYAPHLKATGQGNIWVFADHCREGTDGVSLIPALAEVVEWMCAARDIQPVYMYKGMIPQVDWFGPFRPCMDVPTHPQGGLQTTYLDMIKEANITEIAGEADDFCVRHGCRQVLEYYAGSPAVLESIRFLSDCTSAIVPDDPASGNTANADFRKAMEAQGVRMITHDSPF